MTTVLVDSGSSFEMLDANISDAFNYANSTLTPTLAHYYDDPLNYMDYIGTGLTYDSNGNMTGGTLTGVVSV
ncbi:MAG: hypothetical protein KDK75_19760, partial [Alphaproteobacteria bacterium]|nr:hypothetical protein [Alphaproteobacteria bacterium]